MGNNTQVWLASGLRTPFAKIDGALSTFDAISLSVHVVQAMTIANIRPDVLMWGTVVPNLSYSNIAREIQMDAGLDQAIPAFSSVMACSTSMMAALQAATIIESNKADLILVGGVDVMSRVQIGLTQKLSDWLRRFFQGRSVGEKFETFKELNFRDIKLFVPSVTNRTTGKSMGEHCEEMAQTWKISRDAQDKLALASHDNAAAGQAAGFFDDLIIPIEATDKDLIPRADSSLEKLAKLKPVFDRRSGLGTITAGNSSPLTDGAAGVWLTNELGLKKLPENIAAVKLVDWEISAVDIEKEGLLMAPSYAIPRLLARHDLGYENIDLWEIHEAFAAQVLCNVAALEDKDFVKNKTGVEQDLGPFPLQRVNPNGGSVAIGHPFGATGARDLSQATKTLASMPAGSYAIVSICADGGLGTVALLQSA